MNKNEFTEKQRENRMEDKKALKKFLPLLLLFFVVGVACGMGSVMLGSLAENGFWAGTIKYVKWLATYGGLFLNTGLILADIVLLRKCRKEYAGWDEEDESVLSKIDIKLGYALWFSSLIMYIAYFFFATGVWATGIGDAWASPEDIPVMGLAAIFFNMIGSLAAACIIQQRAVNLEKEINPEKAGSVYDAKFANKWLDSSDEAEKFTAYKCAYRSHRTVNRATMALWVICLIGQMSFHTGPFATIVTSIILIVQVSAYSLQAIYFAKNPSEVMK